MAIDKLRNKAEGAFSWANWLAEKTVEYASALLGCCANWLGNQFPKLGNVFNTLGIGKLPSKGVQSFGQLAEDTLFSGYTREFIKNSFRSFYLIFLQKNR